MLKVKRDFFSACAQPLNLKVIISMKHVTHSAWLPISMEELKKDFATWPGFDCLESEYFACFLTG